MAINLLLDTCILVRLLNVLEDDRNIHKLSIWLKLEEIQLYVPLVILDEWKLRKDEKLKQIETDINKIKKQQKANLGFPDVEARPVEIEIGMTRMKRQIEIIDAWIKAGITYPEGPASMAAREQQRADANPPFQGGKASENDAIIIFSTLEKLLTEGEKQLFFVSTNTKDFCSKENNRFKLHPTIQAKFQDVSVDYYETLNKFVDDAITGGFLSRRPETVSDKSGVLENFPIDSSLHPIDQLYTYLTDRFRTIRFLPRSLYTTHFPIAVKTDRDLFDRAFTVATNNVKLYEFLQSVTINQGKPENLNIESIESVDRYHEKILEILGILNFNLAHQVSLKHLSPKPVATVEKDVSDLLVTQYRHLKFAELWPIITVSADDTLTSLMEKGYINYKLGNYANAARIYQRARKIAEEQSIHDIAYFATFSLSKLGQFVSVHVFNKAEVGRLQDDLDSIDLEGTKEAYTTRQNKNILSWMANNRFISEGVALLSAMVSDVAKLEHQRTSGWNTNFLTVLNAYLEIDYFLLYNNVVFDQFSEFTTLTDSFIRGLFASYASNQRLNGQLEAFPEWLLETLMINGTADMIKYYVSRYKIRYIDYKIEKFDYFEKILLPFLQSIDDLRSGSDQLDTDTARNFNDHLDKFLGNAFILIAITNLRPDLEETLIGAAHNILESWKSGIHPPLLDHLNFIFYKKNDKITSDWARKFLMTFIKTKTYTRDGPFTNLIHILRKNRQTLLLTDDEFKVFENNWLILDHGRLSEAEIVFEITNILQSPEQRSRVAAFVSDTLKVHFDESLLYLADFSKLIQPTDVQLKLVEDYLMDRLFPPPPTTALRRPSLRYPYAIPVDRYIHYCREHDHPIPPNLQSAILDLDPYYAWVFDPESFDYNHFQPEWLEHTLTKALKPTLKSSLTLKEHIEHLLKLDRDNNVLWSFFEIFHT